MPDATPAADAKAAPAIELDLTEAAAQRVFRLPVLGTMKAGRAKTCTLGIVWHDRADGALAAANLALSESRGQAVLEKLRPDETFWPAATPAPVIARAETIPALETVAGQLLPSGPMGPVAAFNGRQREVALSLETGPARLILLDGTLRGVLQDRPVRRLILAGGARDMASLAALLAGHIALSPPRASLAAEALSVARGAEPAPRRLGTASVTPGATLSESIADVTAYLGDVMLHWSGAIGRGEAMEPVHQMRVALRRLRSALSVFGRAMPAGDWRDTLTAELKNLGRLLGTARDWDVFLAETGAELREAFPGDARMTSLLESAGRKRRAAYAALQAHLDDPGGWKAFSLRLALLPTMRPWDGGDALGESLDAYARRALTRRLKHVLAPGASLSGLSHEALHGIRKQAKRLRYAVEFLAPLFPPKPVRRYLSRMEDMQAVFGTLNDCAVASELASQLGSGFAVGAVQGYEAARFQRAVRRVHKVWERFYRDEPFWT